MTHLFVNGLAASAGAGLTYIRNIVPQIAARNDVQATVAITSGLRQELGAPPNVSFVEAGAASALKRFWQEQTRLPEMIRQSGADVLLSTGNFALRNSPVPQILLSGNSLYVSQDFFRDLWRRYEYRMWADTRVRSALARRSIFWADRTVAPSQAFADDLHRWTGKNVDCIHHGFDRELFFRDTGGPPADLASKLLPRQEELRLLFVSHYNYYRNFETLLRAIPLLQPLLPGRALRLFLTCSLRPGENPGSYRPDAASALVRSLGIEEQVVELGAVPYHLLHHVYRSSNVYVTPAYAETFAHPLVEAMASGLPVVASDLAVHREICGESALFFARFSPDELAQQVSRVALDDKTSNRMSQHALQRASEFSWKTHLEKILAIASTLKSVPRNNAQR